MPLIVAALECNTGAHYERLDEYSPYRFEEKGLGRFEGHGDETMQWFLQEFKPFVDSECRTLPDRGPHLHCGQFHGRADEPVRPVPVQTMCSAGPRPCPPPSGWPPTG